MSVTEDQKRGLRRLHGVLGHTTKVEKAFAKAFLDALPGAAREHGLGFTDRYAYVVHKQAKYEAGRLRHYITKLTRYLARTRAAQTSSGPTTANASSMSPHGSAGSRA
jgi:hypothetical protein